MAVGHIFIIINGQILVKYFLHLVTLQSRPLSHFLSWVFPIKIHFPDLGSTTFFQHNLFPFQDRGYINSTQIYTFLLLKNVCIKRCFPWGGGLSSSYLNILLCNEWSTIPVRKCTFSKIKHSDWLLQTVWPDWAFLEFLVTNFITKVAQILREIWNFCKTFAKVANFRQIRLRWQSQMSLKQESCKQSINQFFIKNQSIILISLGHQNIKKDAI